MEMEMEMELMEMELMEMEMEMEMEMGRRVDDTHPHGVLKLGKILGEISCSIS